MSSGAILGRCLLLALLCVPAAPALGQAPSSPPAGADADRGYKWALGLGLGVVQPDGNGETYLSGSVRRRLGGPKEERPKEPATGEVAPWNREPRREGSVRAYVEGEVGYWKRSATTGDDRDLLLGLNAIGVIPTRNIDLFLGVGFGAHFTDFNAIAPAESKTRFGGNIQFGVELRASDTVGIFGVGRVDQLEGDRHRQQSKIWGGLRLRL